MSRPSPIRNEACPKCVEEGFDAAGDNLAIFESGVKYCVARHGTIGKGEIVASEPSMELKQPVDSKFTEGVYAAINSRGISKKTCEFYGYKVNVEKKLHIAEYYNTSGDLIAQQFRTPDKQFPIVGDRSITSQLWGAHRFTPDKRVFITVTEGQIDALSIAEVFSCKYPVVSLPNGAKGAPEVIQKNKKYLEGFKHVVFAFDMDKDGVEATEKCLRILEPGVARVARLTAKDANEMLVKGEEFAIRDAIYNAVQYLPEPILTGDNLLSCLKDYQIKQIAWPWKSAEVIQPLSIPAVYTIAAKPGVGKTEFVGELMRQTVDKGGRIGIVALEQTIQQVLIKMTDTLTGSKLSKIVGRDFTEEEQKHCSEVAKSLVIYDHITYGSDLETIVATIPHMVKTLNCELVIFDNLSYSATNISGDERKGIDKAMIGLKDSTVKYQYALINVAHLKRDGEGGFSEGDLPVSVEMIRGSQGVEMFSDYIIGLHREKGSDDARVRNTLVAYVLKDRFSGQDTGKNFKMFFNHETRRLEDFK